MQTLDAMFECLLQHGCENLSLQEDPKKRTQFAIAGGGSGDIYRGKLYNGTDIAIKALRHGTEGSPSKGLKVRPLYIIYPKRMTFDIGHFLQARNA
jgi:hypothetical protein